MMDDFTLRFTKWTDWKNDHPKEYELFNKKAKVIYSGGELTLGDPRDDDFKLFKISPWKPIFSFMGKAIKNGYDPLQVDAAMHFIIHSQEKFQDIENKYQYLVKVMDSHKINVNEKRWQDVKMNKGPTAMKNILEELFNKMQKEGK